MSFKSLKFSRTKLIYLYYLKSSGELANVLCFAIKLIEEKKKRENKLLLKEKSTLEVQDIADKEYSILCNYLFHGCTINIFFL